MSSYCGIEITGFTAAPLGWRVVWLDLDCDPVKAVTAPLAGWLTGTDPETGGTVVEAATHCPGLHHGEAPSSACVYPVSEADEYPAGFWKILGPGDPLPSPEEAQAEAEHRERRAGLRAARQPSPAREVS